MYQNRHKDERKMHRLMKNINEKAYVAMLVSP